MRRLVIFLSVLVVSVYVHAQEEQREVRQETVEGLDTAVYLTHGALHRVKNYFRNSNKDKGKKFDCGVLAFPYYNATASLIVGGGVSALYSWDATNPELPKSTLVAVAMVSVRGMVEADIIGNNYMKRDAWRWSYSLKVSTTPMYFWGMGYAQGADNSNKSSYKQLRVHFRPDCMFRVAPHLYVGPIAYISYDRTYDFSKRELLEGQSPEIMATGVGVAMSFDSRDNRTNAYHGQYLKVEHLFYPKFMNKCYFNSFDLSFSTYHPLWRSATFALEYHNQFNYGGEVPWTMLALVASNTGRMRGYYEGRYRDRNIIEAQVELRQRLPKRFGVVAFAGAANVFPYFDEIHLRQTLPNYGVGGRWEFKKRVNIRCDIGFTKNKPGVVFSMNEAF